MRVVVSGLVLLLISTPMAAEEPAWALSLEERAVRRADPVANAARHQAWVAKGRQGLDPTSNMVDGSIDPTMIAPIELIDSVNIYHLPPARQAKFRADWTARGAERVLGADFWSRLKSIFAPLAAVEGEIRRIQALRESERQAARAALFAKRPSSDGYCEARAETLIAARQAWGRETFDRFLYEVVAPGTNFSIGGSPDATKSEYWVDQWKWMEGGCR
jgi:hypothetical protein